MTIAVLCALPAELEPVLAGIDAPVSFELAGFEGWLGHRGETPVVVALAGMGKVATGALVTALALRYQPSAFLFTGVAGGLSPAAGVGDIVIGDRTIQHDYGTLEPDGLQRYQPGHLPIHMPTDAYGYPATAAWVDAALTASEQVTFAPVLGRSPAVHVGTIATGDQFVHDAGFRDELHASTGAIAVEMEGAALAQCCERLGVEHLVIRSLSDLAGDETIEHFDEFVPPVAANSARLVLALLDHPPVARELPANQR